MNNFFTDSVIDLGIDRSLHVEPVIDAYSPVDRAIKMYRNHRSIICIKHCGYITRCFSFKPITREHVHQIISKLGTSKAFQRDHIPPKILKANVDIRKEFLSSDINNCIGFGKFPSSLKNSDISPIFKKHPKGPIGL